MWTLKYWRNSLCSRITDQMRNGKLPFLFFALYELKWWKVLKQTQKWQQQVRDLPVTKANIAVILVCLLSTQEEGGKEFHCFLTDQHLLVFIQSLCSHSLAFIMLLAYNRETTCWSRGRCLWILELSDWGPRIFYRDNDRTFTIFLE